MNGTHKIVDHDGYTLAHDASLLARNTFHVAARARVLAEVRESSALGGLLDEFRNEPLLVLGEGSNILFTHDWPGIVVSIATRGVALIENHGERAQIRVEAGESWNDFVRWSLAQGFAGLENLIAIPGTVGAAPIQNIGAYGVEVCEFIDAVGVWDREQHEHVRIPAADCAFGYRDSLFKRERERYIVTAVEFMLPRTHALRIDYAGVREELSALGISEPTPSRVAAAIARIRARKLPDPARIGNAGSFFKNPLVDHATLAHLRSEHPALPWWPADAGHAKLSAAWLIETCGLKGFRAGDAGISAQHALVLVNHGHATGAELGALAKHVRATVRSRLGVEIEAEPRII